MVELVTILLLTLGQLNAEGLTDEAIAKGIEQAVMEDPPVAIGSMALVVSHERPAADAEPDPDAPYILNFSFEDIYIDPLEVHALDLQISGVEVLSDGRIRLGSVSFSAELADGELSRALAPQAEKLPGLKIDCDDGLVTLSGRYAAWISEVPFEVSGNLGIKHTTELIFSIDNSKLVGISLPARLNELIEEEVNPVFDLLDFAERSSKDLDKLREKLVYEFAFRVDNVKSQEGHILIKGKA